MNLPALELFKRRPALRRWLWPAAAAAAFLLFLWLTFPYDTLARRIEFEALGNGTELTIGHLGSSGPFGLRARDVRLRLAAPPGGEPLPELRFERADVHPDLLPLLLQRTSFGFSLAGYGGTATGHAAFSNDPRTPGLKSLSLDARDFDLHELPLRELAGLEAAGKLQLKVDLPVLMPADAANGSATVSLDGGALNGGAVMGFPLPKTVLGRLEGAVNVDKGVASVQKTTLRGGDLDAEVDGNVHLRPLFALSQGDLHVRFRPSERWLDQNQMIKGAMGLLQNARQGDGSYLFTFSGPLSHLSSRPGR